MTELETISYRVLFLGVRPIAAQNKVTGEYLEVAGPISERAAYYRWGWMNYSKARRITAEEMLGVL